MIMNQSRVKMIRQRVCLVLLAIVAAATAKPPPKAGGPPPSAGFAVYARSLGPQVSPAMSTITVPYVPKASPFFPKLVDPQTMITKKTDMLTNLFGGIGPVNYPAGAPFASAGPSPWAAKPLLYATDPEPSKDASKDVSDLQEILGEDKKTTNALKGGIFRPQFALPPPFSPKFAPVPHPSQYSSFYPMETPEDDTSSRRKRQILRVAPETPKNISPPPPYPGLSSIPEEPETDASGVPKQYLPGMFGPFSPFAAPFVDPSIYITKKTAFLNSLFSSLATSTPAPPGTIPDPTAPKSTIVPPSFWLPFAVPTEASVADVTDVPVPKSTIVPPDFWFPSSIIPGPTEYNDKVSVFLEKLFDSLKLNKTKIASTGSADDMPKTIVKRSVDDLQTITTAKDAIVDSIMEELGSIKTDMYNTMNDMIIAQKTAAAFAKPGKPGKPAKPLSPWAAMFAAPTVDPMLPFKQKMMMLSQVFDMLTGMQKNITKTIQETVKAAPVTPAPADIMKGNEFMDKAMNATLLDAIKTKLDSLEKAEAAPVQPFPGFWGAYPGVYSTSSAAKRNVHDEDYYQGEKEKRGVKMTMHQGYQSMPPGAIETVQAGGGTVLGHQGGGIKLFIQMPPAGSPDYENEPQQNDYEDWGKQWAEWAQNFKSQDNGQRHHHNHH